MIDVEDRMSRACITIPEAERLRQHLLLRIVDINYPAVQTREVVLRTLNSNLNAIFSRLVNQREELQVTICEKKNSTILDEELKVLDRFYFQVISKFESYGMAPQHADMIKLGLQSNSAIMRVAARCAVVLTVAFIELDL